MIQECEELVSKGITGTGEGFDGTGRRLGGFTIHPPPPSLRQATLAAAHKRARNGALLPSGPRKLGGNNDIMSALSPVQAAAMAAERRLHDDLWCGSHDQSGIDDDSDDVVILNESPNLTARDGRTTKSSNTFPQSSTSSGSHTVTQEGSSSCRTTADASDDSLWECGACTLLNQASFSVHLVLCKTSNLCMQHGKSLIKCIDFVTKILGYIKKVIDDLFFHFFYSYEFFVHLS
jgi:DNA-dependent metalloprotease WSS1